MTGVSMGEYEKSVLESIILQLLLPSQFYCELLLWWSNFRDTFASDNEWQNIIWNNKEIPIDNKPVFYKNYLESGVIYVRDLQFDLNT